MKRFAGIWICLLAPMALAQQTAFPGTKKDVISAPVTGGTSTLGVVQLAQMLIAMGVVFAVIKYILPKIATRMGKKLNTKLGSDIKIEESASFAGGMLYVVQARSRTLLISAGTQGVSCLADLTEQPKKEEPFTTFKEMVEAQPEQTDAGFAPQVEVKEDEDPSPGSANEALEALRRLAK